MTGVSALTEISGLPLENEDTATPDYFKILLGETSFLQTQCVPPKPHSGG